METWHQMAFKIWISCWALNLQYNFNHIYFLLRHLLPKLFMKFWFLTPNTITYLVKTEYRWKLWLKVSFIICRYATRTFLEIPTCAHHVIFISQFVLLTKNPPFYKVNSFNRKWLAHRGISKKNILGHFSPSFIDQKC